MTEGVEPRNEERGDPFTGGHGRGGRPVYVTVKSRYLGAIASDAHCRCCDGHICRIILPKMPKIVVRSFDTMQVKANSLANTIRIRILLLSV